MTCYIFIKTAPNVIILATEVGKTETVEKEILAFAKERASDSREIESGNEEIIIEDKEMVASA